MEGVDAMTKAKELVEANSSLLPSLLSLAVAEKIANEALEWAAQQCEAGDCPAFDGNPKCHKEDAIRIRSGKSQ